MWFPSGIEAGWTVLLINIFFNTKKEEIQWCGPFEIHLANCIGVYRSGNVAWWCGAGPTCVHDNFTINYANKTKNLSNNKNNPIISVNQSTSNSLHVCASHRIRAQRPNYKSTRNKVRELLIAGLHSTKCWTHRRQIVIKFACYCFFFCRPFY